MSTNNFLSKENKRVLWEVIISQTKDSREIDNIYSVFSENIERFEKEKNNYENLIQMNKKFITLIIQYIKTFSERKDLITHSDIENKRRVEFEEKYNKKQSEFTNAMTLKIPPKPDFSEKIDMPMNEKEFEMKHAIKIKQNFEPLESYNEKKYIKIDAKNMDDVYKNEVVHLEESAKKHISWGDTQFDIFSKLKIIDPQKDMETKIMNLQEELIDIRAQLSYCVKTMQLLEDKLEKINFEKNNSEKE